MVSGAAQWASASAYRPSALDPQGCTARAARRAGSPSPLRPTAPPLAAGYCPPPPPRLPLSPQHPLHGPTWCPLQMLRGHAPRGLHTAARAHANRYRGDHPCSSPPSYFFWQPRPQAQHAPHAPHPPPWNSLGSSSGRASVRLGVHLHVLRVSLSLLLVARALVWGA